MSKGVYDRTQSKQRLGSPCADECSCGRHQRPPLTPEQYANVKAGRASASFGTTICVLCGQVGTRRGPTGRYFCSECLESWSAYWNSVWESQGGRCGICETPFEELVAAPSPDHDHQHGVCRGLLCSRCNLAIGQLRDSTGLLRKALMYMEEWEAQNLVNPRPVLRYSDSVDKPLPWRRH